MDQNKTTAVDERIAKVIARRAGASSAEQYPVTIEQGQEPQRPRAGAGQIESSVHMSTWKEVDAPPKTIKPADIKNVDPVEPSADQIITIGRVTLQPSAITGWEAKFTRGHTPIEVRLDGEVVTGALALQSIYDVLMEQKNAQLASQAKKGAK